MRVAAILTAAGSGSRLGSSGPKALVPLAGVPLVVRAARALVGSGQIDLLIVTAPMDLVETMRSVLEAARPPVVAQVVPGGVSRQASVAAGLDRLAAVAGVGPDLVVLVHDAARPLVPAGVVQRVVAAVQAGHSAVVPGLGVADTIKQVTDGTDEAGAVRVLSTPDRGSLRAVQTPQGFTFGALRRAHAAGAARAGDESRAATDDATLVEELGLDVWVVDGHEDAMKITTPRDLALAEVLLAGAP